MKDTYLFETRERKSSRNNKYVFILASFLFLLFFISFVSSTSVLEGSVATGDYKAISLATNPTISALTEFTDMKFSSDGLHLYLLSAYASPVSDYIFEYKLTSPFDVSTATYTFPNFLNNSLYSETFGTISNKTSSFILLSNGIDLYTSSTITLGLGAGKLRHFKLTNQYNISSAVLQSSENFTIGDTGNGLFVSDDGLNIVSSSNDAVVSYTMSQAYNLSTTSGIKSVFVKQSDSDTNPYREVANIYLSQDGLNMYGAVRTFTSPSSNINHFQYALSSAFNVSTATMTSNFTNACVDVTYPQTLFYSYSGINYWATQCHILADGGFIRSYSFGDSTNTIGEGNTSVAVTQLLINPLLSVFPDSSSLTFKQKIGYVIVFMFLSAIILLVCSYLAFGNVSSIFIYIIALLEVILFIFFITIGYINIGILIIIILIALALSYFKFRGSSQ